MTNAERTNAEIWTDRQADQPFHPDARSSKRTTRGPGMVPAELGVLAYSRVHFYLLIPAQGCPSNRECPSLRTNTVPMYDEAESCQKGRARREPWRSRGERLT